MRKKTTETVIRELKELYGDFFDYSKLIFNGSQKKFCLICPEHGEFYIRYDKIIKGQGCPLCNKEKRETEKIRTYIERAKMIHKNHYQYDYANWDNINNKVKIICPEHGEFFMTLNNHINMKQGCPKCHFEKQKGNFKISTEEFIKKAKSVHGDKYDYSETVYNGLKNKVKIICPEHGVFEQVAYDHLRGFKCKECKHKEDRLTKEEFIEKAKLVHGDKYDYTKVEYINNQTPIKIVCPTHGEFKMKPSHHLMGMGCHFCNTSRLENEIKLILEQNNIVFIPQYRNKWLGKQSLDFYLPEYNIAIECQGKQHFEPINYFGGEKRFITQKKRDILKYNKCKEHNITLYYFGKYNVMMENYFKDAQELIKKIKAS